MFHSLKTLPTHKTTAGNLPNYVLRKLAPVITQSLTALFNHCIEKGDFPQEWKIAEVIPLYQGKGSPTNPSMYRPISLLNSVTKLYESLVSRQLYRFVEENAILTPHQYGFRRQRSTVDQLLRLTSRIRVAFDQRRLCDAVF